MTIRKKERTVSMEIAAKQLIPLQKWEDLRGELLKNLPGIREVDIDITYEIEETDPEVLAEGYWESIQTFVSQQSKVCAGVISDATWEMKDGKMQIFVKNNMAYYLSQKHLDDAIMNMIEMETGSRDYHIQPAEGADVRGDVFKRLAERQKILKDAKAEVEAIIGVAKKTQCERDALNESASNEFKQNCSDNG